MAPRRKLTLGVGATVSCLLKFLHPSGHIRNAFPNPAHAQRLSDCVVVRQEVKKVSQRQQLCLIVTHRDFKNNDDPPTCSKVSLADPQGGRS